MLWPNLYSPSVMWKKLDRVNKDCVILRIVKFWRVTHGQGDGWEGGCETVLIDINLSYIISLFSSFSASIMLESTQKLSRYHLFRQRCKK